MAIAIDASTPAAVVSNTAVASLTTAAFTPPVGAVLLMVAIFDTATNTRTGTPSTVTGTTSAWTTVGDFNNGTGTTGGLVHISWARVTASVSTTARVTWPASNDCALKVWVLTGAPSSGSPIGKSGSVTLSTNPQTVSYTASDAGSQGFIGLEDFSQAGAKTISNTTVEATLSTNSNGVIARDSSVSGTLGQSRSFSIGGTPGGASVGWVEVIPATGGGGGGTGGGGGPLTDRLDVAYTNSAGTASTGHIYASGLDWSKTVGVLVYTDGSGEFGLANPTNTYLLAGTNGLIAVAKKHNMILVTPRAPGGGCDDGDGVCWYDNSGTMLIPSKIKWADDFIQTQVLSQYDVDRTRVVIAGYSSGAQFTTEYYGPQYASAWMQDGLLLAISYGGSPKVTVNYPTAFKNAVAAVWDVGSADPSYQSSGAFGVQAGYDAYVALGFVTTELNVVSGEDHARDGLFGGIVDREVTQHVPVSTAVVGLAVRALSPAIVGGSAASLQTATFSPPAGSVLLACVHADPGRTFTLTTTVATGLPWTQVVNAFPTGLSSVTAWWAPLASGAANMSVTATGSVNNDFGLKVYVVTGADAANPIGAVSTGGATAVTGRPLTRTLVPQAAGSLGFLIADASATGDIDVTSSSDTTWTGYSLLGNIAGGSGWRVMGAAGGTESFSATVGGTATAQWAWGVFEVRAEPTVASPVTNSIITHGSARSRAAQW